MTQEEIKIITEKINSLDQKRPKRNPLPTPPPGYPRMGPYSQPRAMSAQQAAIQIKAAVNNMLRCDSEISENVWERKLYAAKDQVIRFSDKCWRYCNNEEAEEIVKLICSMEDIPFPPKFKSTDE